VDGLEVGRALADIARRAHAEAADGSPAEVREDIAEEVLHHEHVEVPGVLHEPRGRRIRVHVLELDVGELLGHAAHALAEEREAAQHVRLVHARDPPPAIAGRARALARDREGPARDAIDSAPRHHHGVERHVLRDEAAAPRGVETLVFSRTTT
jgi:hypothetical protein